MGWVGWMGWMGWMGWDGLISWHYNSYLVKCKYAWTICLIYSSRNIPSPHTHISPLSVECEKPSLSIKCWVDFEVLQDLDLTSRLLFCRKEMYILILLGTCFIFSLTRVDGKIFIDFCIKACNLWILHCALLELISTSLYVTQKKK